MISFYLIKPCAFYDHLNPLEKLEILCHVCPLLLKCCKFCVFQNVQIPRSVEHVLVWISNRSGVSLAGMTPSYSLVDVHES